MAKVKRKAGTVLGEDERRRILELRETIISAVSDLKGFVGHIEAGEVFECGAQNSLDQIDTLAYYVVLPEYRGA